MSEPMSRYVIVRTQNAGVFFGIIEKEKGRTITMTNARRLWFWSGAASLSQLAVDGTSKPNECKFPIEVPHVKLHQVIEIIDVTTKAEKSIRGVKVWNA